MKVKFSNHQNDLVAVSTLQSWQEPAIAFERSLMAEAQGGPGPHGGPSAPSGLLGPLSTSGNTGGPNTCGT